MSDKDTSGLLYLGVNKHLVRGRPFLVVSVFKGTQLRSTNNERCCSLIKVSFTPTPSGPVPEERMSRVVVSSNNPKYNCIFRIPLTPELRTKSCQRIVISIYNLPSLSFKKELIGRLSFSIQKIASGQRYKGWYYLLDAKLGKKKHIQFEEDFPTSPINEARLDEVESKEWGHCPKLFTFRYLVNRCKMTGEFGLEVEGSAPVRIDFIHPESEALLAGLRVGDVITRVNAQNVRDCSDVEVLNMLKACASKVLLEVQRLPRPTNSPTVSMFNIPAPYVDHWALALEKYVAGQTQCSHQNAAKTFRNTIDKLVVEEDETLSVHNDGVMIERQVIGAINTPDTSCDTGETYDDSRQRLEPIPEVSEPTPMYSGALSPAAVRPDLTGQSAHTSQSPVLKHLQDVYWAKLYSERIGPEEKADEPSKQDVTPKTIRYTPSIRGSYSKAHSYVGTPVNLQGTVSTQQRGNMVQMTVGSNLHTPTELGFNNSTHTPRITPQQSAGKRHQCQKQSCHSADAFLKRSSKRKMDEDKISDLTCSPASNVTPCTNLGARICAEDQTWLGPSSSKSIKAEITSDVIKLKGKNYWLNIEGTPHSTDPDLLGDFALHETNNTNSSPRMFSFTERVDEDSKEDLAKANAGEALAQAGDDELDATATDRYTSHTTSSKKARSTRAQPPSLYHSRGNNSPTMDAVNARISHLHDLGASPLMKPKSAKGKRYVPFDQVTPYKLKPCIPLLHYHNYGTGPIGRYLRHSNAPFVPPPVPPPSLATLPTSESENESPLVENITSIAHDKAITPVAGNGHESPAGSSIPLDNTFPTVTNVNMYESYARAVRRKSAEQYSARMKKAKSKRKAFVKQLLSCKPLAVV